MGGKTTPSYGACSEEKAKNDEPDQMHNGRQFIWGGIVSPCFSPLYVNVIVALIVFACFAAAGFFFFISSPARVHLNKESMEASDVAADVGLPRSEFTQLKSYYKYMWYDLKSLRMDPLFKGFAHSFYSLWHAKKLVFVSSFLFLTYFFLHKEISKKLHSRSFIEKRLSKSWLPKNPLASGCKRREDYKEVSECEDWGSCKGCSCKCNWEANGVEVTSKTGNLFNDDANRLCEECCVWERPFDQCRWSDDKCQRCAWQDMTRRPALSCHGSARAGFRKGQEVRRCALLMG